MLKAIIFDVDGTLADTERQGHRVAFNRAFADMGLDWYWDEALYLALLAVPGGKERLCHYIETCHPKMPPRPDPADESRDAFIKRLHRRKTSHYLSLLDEASIPLRPGISRLLMEARRNNMRVAIASTSDPVNIKALLQVGPVGCSPFEVIAGGDIVPHKKPAPDVYQYVLREMRLEAHECLAIEDSAAGLQAARAAGIPTLITCTDYTSNQDFSGALLVINHLGEPDTPTTCLTTPPWPDFRLVDLAALKRLHGSSGRMS